MQEGEDGEKSLGQKMAEMRAMLQQTPEDSDTLPSSPLQVVENKCAPPLPDVPVPHVHMPALKEISADDLSDFFQTMSASRRAQDPIDRIDDYRLPNYQYKLLISVHSSLAKIPVYFETYRELETFCISAHLKFEKQVVRIEEVIPDAKIFDQTRAEDFQGEDIAPHQVIYKKGGQT